MLYKYEEFADIKKEDLIYVYNKKDFYTIDGKPFECLFLVKDIINFNKLKVEYYYDNLKIRSDKNHWHVGSLDLDFLRKAPGWSCNSCSNFELCIHKDINLLIQTCRFFYELSI